MSVFGLRRARPARSGWNVAKTLAAAGVAQAVMIVVIPSAIMRLHWALGSDLITLASSRATGAAILATGGSLYLLAALSLAVVGRGTPLSFDSPRRLVTVGPYARVRNPMLAGLGVQGLGLIAYSGSALMIAYLVFGVIGWLVLTRPAEEHELVRTFGREYESYRRNVPALWPRRTAWHAVDDAPVRSIVLDGEGRRRRRRPR